MTFIVLTCPSCGRRILMDETDGIGYCMYCGARIDAAGTDAEYLDPQSESLVEMVVEGATETDFSGEPWYPSMAESVELLMSGRPEEAAASFSDAIGDAGDDANAMKDAMAETLARWVLRTVFDGKVYEGGVNKMAPLLVIEGQGDTHPPVLIEGLFDAICQSLNMIESPAHAESMAASLLHLLCDYLEAEPSLENQEVLMDGFVSQCEVLEDLTSQADESASEIGSIEMMREAAEILLSSVKGVSSGQPEGRLEALADHWDKTGIYRISERACNVLTRVREPSFKDSAESWREISEDSEAYAASYIEPEFRNRTCLIGFAGTPATTVRGGTSLVTTAPAATTAPSPIVTPPRIVACEPIHTRLPMTMGFAMMSLLRSGSRSWFRVANSTPFPICDSSPIHIPPWSWKWQQLLMNTPLPIWRFFPKSE